MALTTEKPVADPQTPCPRCGKPLVDAAGLGWCQACGYCRSLAEAPVKIKPVAPAEPTAAAAAVKQTGQAISRIPFWCYLLVASMGAIAVVSLWQGRRLPPQGLPRALWTTIQIGTGLLLIFFGQIIALVRVAPEDPLLSFKDMFLPFRLWSQVFKRANQLYQPILLASWGLAITLSAFIFIGGLGHWMTYLPGGKNAPAKKVGP